MTKNREEHYGRKIAIVHYTGTLGLLISIIMTMKQSVRQRCISVNFLLHTID